MGVKVQVEEYPNAVSVLRVVRQGELQAATINVNRNGQTGPIYSSVYAFGSYYRINIEAGQNSFIIPGVPYIDYTVYTYYPDDASLGQTWNYNEENQVLTDGSFDVTGVLEGEMYRFKISYDGKQCEHELRVTGPNVNYTNTIDDDICQ